MLALKGSGKILRVDETVLETDICDRFVCLRAISQRLMCQSQPKPLDIGGNSAVARKEVG